MCTARASVTPLTSSLLRKSRLLHVAICGSADSKWQVRIHTSAHQYCHFEDYHTRYWPIVGTAVTRHLLADPLTLFIAAVGTAWSLLGSPRNGQAALYLFQKTFTVLGVHLQLQSLSTFVKQMENAWRCVRCALRLTNVPIHCRPNLPGTGVRSQFYGTTQRTVFSLCTWTRPQELLEGRWSS